jgi:hypothetical protein
MHHDESHQLDYDVTRPPEEVKFHGLLDNPGESGNKLNGLFDWQCAGCKAWNRDVAVVESEQAFLSRWLCNRCAERTVVRFRGRASAEWIAAHALAITGSALCHLADEEFGATAPTPEEGRRGQRVFAWIAVPALVALVLLALSDIRRPSESSAAGAWIHQEIHHSAALSRLVGNWASEDGSDVLSFIHVDSGSLSGTYVYFADCRRPGRRVQFDVLHEDPKGERLVIRQWSENPDGARAEMPGAKNGVDATIYIPLQGRTFTWIDIQEGEPVMKVHHRLDKAPALIPASI